MRRMFSEKQIEKIAQEGLQDGSAVIVAKTLEQKEANNEFAFLETEIANLPEGVEYTKIYCKAIVVNQILHIIFNFELKNTTASATSSFNSVWNDISVPEEIGKHIYCFEGHSLDEEVSGNHAICGGRYSYSSSAINIDEFTSDSLFYLRSNGKNKMALTFRTIPSIPQNNGKVRITGRIALCLL